MKISILPFVLLLLAGINAKAQSEIKRTANGTTYKVLSQGKGNKIELTNIVTFHFIEKTDQDTLLYNTYESSLPFKVRIQASENVLDLMDVFINLREKDSVLIYVPTDSIFKENEMDRPYYLPKGSSIVFHLKILKVQTEEEAIAEDKQAVANEKAVLDKYIKDKKLKPLYTRSGMIVVSKKTTQLTRPQPGDTVYINYTASTVNGKVFDTSVQTEAKKAGLDHAGREYGPLCFVVCETGVITPWDEGILMMSEGARATFLIPSSLAFGAQGFGKFIKPYTTFVIDVEIIKIRKTFVQTFVHKQDKHKYLGNLNMRPGNLPKPIINSLRSFVFLANEAQRNNLQIQKGNTEKAESPWILKWFDIVSELLLKGI